MKAKEQIQKNQFGIPLYIDKSNKSALKTRVVMLTTVVKTGRVFGEKKALSKKDVERAEMHLKWYSAELRKLAVPAKKRKSA